MTPARDIVGDDKAERPPLPPGDARHGTVNGYHHLSCRCDACRRAWATHIAKRRAERPLLPPGDARHGTTNGYSNLKCRCDACRRAWATHIAKRRAERRTSPIPDSVEHGRYTTYSNWSCRCSQCLDACRRRRGQLPRGFRATSDVMLPTPPSVVKGEVLTWLYLNSAMPGRSLQEMTGSDGHLSTHSTRRRGANGWSIDYLDRLYPDATCGAA